MILQTKDLADLILQTKDLADLILQTKDLAGKNSIDPENKGLSKTLFENRGLMVRIKPTSQKRDVGHPAQFQQKQKAQRVAAPLKNLYSYSTKLTEIKCIR